MERVRAAVAEQIKAMDASHDMAHIERVRAMALRLAREEGLSGAALVRVELAALLHDVDDYKYSGSDTQAGATVLRILREEARELLDSGDGDGDEAAFAEAAQRIVAIIEGVSFHGELGAAGAAAPPDLETACVQDADRLDAIGAIGIARCFTFGGARGRPLHLPEEVEPYRAAATAAADAPGLTKEAYMARSGGIKGGASLTHFFEKLLTLKGRMKTRAGRAVAEGRHAVLEQFVEQFLAEWDARA